MDVVVQTRRRIIVEVMGDVTVVTFRDQKLLVDEPIREMGRELLQLVQAGKQRILLDFYGVKQISATVLGQLRNLKQAISSVNGTLRLCSIRPEIYEIFSITMLHRLFSIHPDRATALAAFQPQPSGPDPTWQE